MQALRTIDHRPFPLPRRPWIQRQTWHDLLFAHWPVPPDDLRALVPASLEIDTHAGHAWVGVVPFRMSGVRLRWCPPLPGLHRFPELNLRTYVRHGGAAGVLFLALEAASALAVAAARAWYRLPYHRARMRCEAEGEAIRYASERVHPGAAPAVLRARYGPTGPVERAAPDSLEAFLTERYCLFAPQPDGRVLRADIHHAPWPLQPAFAEIEACTLPAAHGIRLPDVAPHLRFARRIDVAIWAPRKTPRG